ncbi:unnamed protein product [Effrenium voratum]|nr:unnamed protein product [Effrenium voratum]
MWTRYNESSSELHPPSATGGDVTPFSRYPLQDSFYKSMAYSHVFFGFAYLGLMTWQFLGKKGTRAHVQLGLALKWLALCTLGGGWVLQIRHSWFSDPKVFEKHPALFSLPFARAFVSAFGSSTVVSALNCFVVGVKEESRKVSAGSLSHLMLLVATNLSLAAGVNAYVYIFGELMTTPAWSSFHFDMLVEMTVIGSVFPLYDGLNFFVLIQWWRTGSLNYVEHHVMNAVWTMSKSMDS